MYYQLSVLASVIAMIKTSSCLSVWMINIMTESYFLRRRFICITHPYYSPSLMKFKGKISRQWPGDRNESRDHTKMLLISLFSIFCSACLPRTTCPVALPEGWTYAHQSLIKEMMYRFAYRSIWLQFGSVRFFFFFSETVTCVKLTKQTKKQPKNLIAGTYGLKELFLSHGFSLSEE